jgi:hypothetical protein
MKKYLLILLALLLPFAAGAATTPNTFVAPVTPQRESFQFTHSITAGTYETVYTAGSNGSVVTALIESNNDSTATHAGECGIFNSSTQYGTSTTLTTTSPGAATSWNNANILSTWTGLPVDQNGNPFIILVSGDTIQCAWATTVTTSQFVVVTAFGGDY